MAMRIVAEAGRMLGAERMVTITSAHIDGCLYHGRSGTLFCERLVESGAKVSVPATTNVGALNLLDPQQSRLQGETRKLAFRLMIAHEKMGCLPSWTCAPYQAGARPLFGTDVAWGESNAVAFVNSALGARTNRYGDFLDIACAISGRAPYCGLHVPGNRNAKLVFDLSMLPAAVQKSDIFYPVLGALIGRHAGEDVAVVTGLKTRPDEDSLKALFAGAAATGAVGLLHIVGVTPEAADLAVATGGDLSLPRVPVDLPMLKAERDRFNTLSSGAEITCVAMGSPHLSHRECQHILALAGNNRFSVPVYLCTGRHTMEQLAETGLDEALSALGAIFVVDTCVVVTPILPDTNGIMMTNSAKFAHYGKGNTGHATVVGSTHACVASAQAGKMIHDDWGHS